MKTWKCFVDGKGASSRRLAEVRDPFNGCLVGRVCLATPAQIERAVAGATRAFETTRLMPAHARAAMLRGIAEGIHARRRALADLIVAEAGKPITLARGEVDRAVGTFTLAAEEAERIGGELLPMDRTPAGEGHWGITRRFPVGPVGAITPFNFPLNLVAHKVAPALACGAPVVLKPAPQTPLTALALAEIAHRAGAPAGMLSVVPCENDVARPLVEDPRLRVFTFTGSAAVGWMLRARASDRRVTLELGGDAACVVDADADLDAVIPKIAAGAFAYAGQVCISVQRIFVHEKIRRAFERRFVAHVKSKVKSGDPRRPEVLVGPMIDRANAERVVAWLREAEQGGARVLCGGRRRGNVVTPAVVADATPSMKISREEVFGPVVTIASWRRFDAVLRRVNASRHGLQAGIFTHDVRRIARAFRDLDVGGVIINNVPTWRADHMPYGGEKRSGLGREGLRWAIEEMTSLRTLVVNAS